uniref:Uncharacterized protein n=1 Tax=Arundo donax TaxID=35708 RepID=A0A0A8ZNZ9_ARUDO
MTTVLRQAGRTLEGLRTRIPLCVMALAGLLVPGVSQFEQWRKQAEADPAQIFSGGIVTRDN